jgi:predicted nucleic acid-binding protein
LILVDTSVWVDHLGRGERALAALLDEAGVLTHPFVIGELALGNLDQRDLVLGALHNLPQAPVADDSEVLSLIDRDRLDGSGIGYVEAHLVAATRLMPDARLWTRDKRLHAVCARLGLSAPGLR